MQCFASSTSRHLNVLHFLFLTLTSLSPASACCSRDTFNRDVSVAHPRFTDPFGEVDEGEAKTVTCYSVNTVIIPKLRFIWTIDDVPVNKTYLSPIGSGTDVWGNEVYFQQILDYKFSREENGKLLKCGCITLLRKDKSEDNECAMDIVVNYPSEATAEPKSSIPAVVVNAGDGTAVPADSQVSTVSKSQSRLPVLIDGARYSYYKMKDKKKTSDGSTFSLSSLVLLSVLFSHCAFT